MVADPGSGPILPGFTPYGHDRGCGKCTTGDPARGTLMRYFILATRAKTAQSFGIAEPSRVTRLVLDTGALQGCLPGLGGAAVQTIVLP